jgi:hypothetical protein
MGCGCFKVVSHEATQFAINDCRDKEENTIKFNVVEACVGSDGLLHSPQLPAMIDKKSRRAGGIFLSVFRSVMPLRSHWVNAVSALPPRD